MKPVNPHKRPRNVAATVLADRLFRNRIIKPKKGKGSYVRTHFEEW